MRPFVDKLGGLVTEPNKCVQCRRDTNRISPIGNTGAYWHLHYTCERVFNGKG